MLSLLCLFEQNDDSGYGNGLHGSKQLFLCPTGRALILPLKKLLSCIIFLSDFLSIILKN